MPAIAQGEAQALATVGGHLQAPQRACIGLLRPTQHRGAGAAAQALFEGPQRIARVGLDDPQLRQVHPGRLPRRRIGQVGRRDHHHPLALLRTTRQRRQQQRQLAYAIGRQQQLGQRAPRPAALRQQRVERGMAGGFTVRRDRGAASGVPQRARGQQGFDCDHGRHR